MRSAKIFQKVRSGSRQWENLENLLLKKSVNTFQGKVF